MASTLREGSRGDEVRQLQDALRAAGFDPGASDGIYGKRTAQAVRDFQTARGLQVDGVAGPQTWGALQGGGGGQPAAAAASDPATLAAQQYPQYAWALNDPEIGPILKRAASEGWDSQRLQGALYATNWWKGNSSSARSGILQQQTDPATWAQNGQAIGTKIRNLGNSMGIEFSQGQIDSLAYQALMFNWTDEQLRVQMSSIGQLHGDSSILGQVKQIEGEYLIKLTPQDEEFWARRIAGGLNSAQDFQAHLQELAKGKFPSIAKQLDQGLTPYQIAAPYRAQAANDLGISPDAVDLNDPKWNVFMNQPTKDGPQLMTLYDWQRLYRTNPVYGYDRSEQARTQGASLTTELAKQFGVIG